MKNDFGLSPNLKLWTGLANENGEGTFIFNIILDAVLYILYSYFFINRWRIFIHPVGKCNNEILIPFRKIIGTLATFHAIPLSSYRLFAVVFLTTYLICIRNFTTSTDNSKHGTPLFVCCFLFREIPRYVASM